MNDEDFGWGVILGMILIFVFIVGVFDIQNRGEECLGRGFNAILVEDRDNNDLEYTYCARGFSDNSIQEIRTPDWVEQYCNSKGVCIVDGEIVSSPRQFDTRKE